MSAAAVGREEVHYLVHLLSAAALLWFALYSLHVRHHTELLWAVSARRNASSASAEAVLTLTHHAPAWRTEACVCHPTEAFAPRSGYEEQSAAAPCAGLAQQQLWNADIPEQQQPRSAQNNPEQPRVLMFYHIAAMNNWQEVVSDQLSKVVFSGLYERMAKGFVTCCGPTLAAADECADLVGSFGAKFAVTTRCTLEDRQFERATLGQIKNRTRDGDLVLYIHSKGVSTKHQNPADHRAVFQWRAYMEYFLIKQHQRCIALLASVDAVGVDYTSWEDKARHHKIMKHFSGNFWWTTAAYYRTLPDEIAADDYIAPENHLLQKARRIAVLWKSGYHGAGHYNMTYPLARYADMSDAAFNRKLKIRELHPSRW